MSFDQGGADFAPQEGQPLKDQRDSVLKFLARHKIISVVLTIFLALVVNLLAKNYNSSSLIKEISASESIMDKFITANELNLPERDPEWNNEFTYGTSRFGKSIGSLAWDSWFQEQVIPAAKSALVSLREENYRIERLKLLPFDSENSEFRRTYLIHSRIWVELLSDVRECADFRCYLKVRSTTNEEIDSSFKIAKIAADQAIPLLDFLNSREKLKEIFAS